MRSLLFKLFDRFDWYHKRRCDVTHDWKWARSIDSKETARLCERHLVPPKRTYNIRGSLYTAVGSKLFSVDVKADSEHEAQEKVQDMIMEDMK